DFSRRYDFWRRRTPKWALNGRVRKKPFQAVARVIAEAKRSMSALDLFSVARRSITSLAGLGKASATSWKPVRAKSARTPGIAVSVSRKRRVFAIELAATRRTPSGPSIAIVIVA